MPVTRRTRTRPDPYSVAARARSVLACPSVVELVRDGTPVELGGEALGLGDDAGRPTLTCAAGSSLLVAAARREVASVHLTGGLHGRDGTPDHLHVTGRLLHGGTERCGACPEEHHVVVVEPAAVVLTMAGRATPVPVADFLAEEHALNRGYLHRAVTHANDCHAEELRRAVSRRTGLPLPRLLAASLDALTPAGVDLCWIDADGAHGERLRFEPPASSPAELGTLLHRHYASQRSRPWYDEEVFRGLARLRGIECGARYAEAFTVRKLVAG